MPKLKKYILPFVGLVCLVGISSLLYRSLLFSQNSVRTGTYLYHNFIQKYGRTSFAFFWVAYFVGVILMFNRKGRQLWQAKGIYTAFLISLFTEMFGFGLVAYLFSPFFEYQQLIDTKVYRHYWYIFRPLGAYTILIGVGLVLVGWRLVYDGSGITMTGIYRFIRHPQYLGFILIASGLLIYWPTVLSLVLYFPLVAIYIWQAKNEDKYLEQRYGEEFLKYRENVPAFLPIRIKTKVG